MVSADSHILKFNVLSPSEVIDPYSSVIANPTSLTINNYSTIIVTLLYKDGSPLTGREVRLSANPSSNVILVQPASPTDSEGKAIGQVSSSVAQTVEVIATDLTDNVVLSQKPTIQFVAPSGGGGGGGVGRPPAREEFKILGISPKKGVNRGPKAQVKLEIFGSGFKKGIKAKLVKEKKYKEADKIEYKNSGKIIGEFNLEGLDYHKWSLKLTNPDGKERELKNCFTIYKVSDFNFDFKVDLLDFSYLASKWNSADSLADTNLDKKVDLLDFSILVSEWSNQY